MNRQFIESLRKYKRIFIQPHNYPDADALASAYGMYSLLKDLNVRSKILIHGTPLDIKKPNLQHMLNAMDCDIEFTTFLENVTEDLLILVDVQLMNSNVKTFDFKDIICIDHHNTNEKSENSYIHSVLKPNYGSCSTIITEFYEEMGICPSPIVSSLLNFGIYQDTNNFSIKTTPYDRESSAWLDSLQSKSLYETLLHSSLTFDDILICSKALNSIERYKNIVFTRVETTDDNLLGHTTDLLSDIDGVDIVVAYYEKEFGFKLSIRCYHEIMNAPDIALHITNQFSAKGGGHKNKAGAFISRKEYEIICKDISFDLWIKSITINYLLKVERMKIYSTNVNVNDYNFNSILSVTKKSLPIRYIDISTFPLNSETCTIRTLFGDEVINTADNYVIIGYNGEIYPMPKTVFDKSYTKAGKDFTEDRIAQLFKDSYGIKIISNQESVQFMYTDISNLPIAISIPMTRTATQSENSSYVIIDNKTEKHILVAEENDWLMINADNKITHVVRKDLFDILYTRNSEVVKL